MKRIILFGFLISALCVLTACHRVPAFVQNSTMHNLSGTEQKLLADIEDSGIQVIRQGMLFTFVLPTDCFFHHTTHDLYSSREKDLDRLAQFLDYYSHYFASPRITIAGYTDNTWISPNSNLLALHYAETVAAYFQEDGINPNIMLVEGQGSQNSIASNRYPMGTSFNRRVVVTFAYGPTLAVMHMTGENANRCDDATCNTVSSLPASAKHTSYAQKKLRKKTHSVNVNTTKTQTPIKHSTMGWDDMTQCYSAACM